jgi:hypothetical protein
VSAHYRLSGEGTPAVLLTLDQVRSWLMEHQHQPQSIADHLCYALQRRGAIDFPGDFRAYYDPVGAPVDELALDQLESPEPAEDIAEYQYPAIFFEE